MDRLPIDSGRRFAMMQQRDTGAGHELLAHGEAALERGDSACAIECLLRASEAGVGAAQVRPLAQLLTRAARYQGRQAEAMAWVERWLADGVREPDTRAVLLSSQLALCQGLDTARVEALIDDALRAANEAGDDEAFASALSSAAFAAYRRGDLQAAVAYAERAAGRELSSHRATYDACRARMFGAIALADIESALELSSKARAVARRLGWSADVAKESTNLAGFYLRLGCPVEARACAEQGAMGARAAGDRGLARFGEVLAAVATAEIGDLDGALDRFARIDCDDPVFAIEVASSNAYWLLERGGAGDAAAAYALAARALADAERTGTSNRLTILHSHLARCHARAGREQQAAEALERARRAEDRSEPTSGAVLALAIAEVLPPSDRRRVQVLTQARARILRQADQREDPRAFCTEVTLNRRLLELSGGIPADLPCAG